MGSVHTPRGACTAWAPTSAWSASNLADLTEALGQRAASFHADVTDTTDLLHAAEGTASTFGGIDVVIANAGIAPPTTTIAAIDSAVFERTVEVNLLGVWRTVRATLPYVIERSNHKQNRERCP